MPFAILIKHAVRVVHPSIQRCMVVSRAVFLTILSVESVGEFHLAPADRHGVFARTVGIVGSHHIQHHVTFGGVGCEFERHGEVHFMISETGVECFHEIAVDEHLYARVGHTLLDGEEQITCVGIYAHHAVALPGVGECQSLGGVPMKGPSHEC